MLLNVNIREFDMAECEVLELELARKQTTHKPFSRVRCEIDENLCRVSLRGCSRRIQRQVRRLVLNHDAVVGKSIARDGDYLVFQVCDVSKANALLNQVSKITSTPTILSSPRTRKERISRRRRQVSKGREATKAYSRDKHLRSLVA